MPSSGKQAFGIPQKMDTDKQLKQVRQESGSGGSASSSPNNSFSSGSSSPPPAQKMEKQVVGIPQAKDYDKQLRGARSAYSKEQMASSSYENPSLLTSAFQSVKSALPSSLQ
mmetsp:Transcript_37115/g.93814  ORF Transcript_37115/g.93814 Transcript_37115/m.93814 type:complete len:112 (+) Transcript_37115:209-544(+)